MIVRGPNITVYGFNKSRDLSTVDLEKGCGSVVWLMENFTICTSLSTLWL